VSIESFNAASGEAARELLLVCLDVPRWADEIAAGRPYDDLGEVASAMGTASSTVTDDELERALARHPRIGERADAQKHDAEHSAREQSGIDAADAALTEELRAGNVAYEERFGRVFIIRAAGRDGPEILGELRRRLANDDAHERAETIEQLTQIALLRIREVLS
jgi:2-oxo-4-hydroxy-4-carboxy-5-ureidoimidazoline decarboxylase